MQFFHFLSFFTVAPFPFFFFIFLTSLCLSPLKPITTIFSSPCSRHHHLVSFFFFFWSSFEHSSSDNDRTTVTVARTGDGRSSSAMFSGNLWAWIRWYLEASSLSNLNPIVISSKSFDLCLNFIDFGYVFLS